MDVKKTYPGNTIQVYFILAVLCLFECLNV